MTNTNIMGLPARIFEELEMCIEDGAKCVESAVEVDRGNITSPMPTLYFQGVPYVKLPDTKEKPAA